MIKKLFLFVCIFFSATAFSQTPYEPVKGSTERKEVLDIFRKDCEGKCQFKVHHFLINNGWACANVSPLLNGEEDGEPRWGLFRKTNGSWKQVNWSNGVDIKNDFELIDIPIQNSRIAKIIIKKYPGCPMNIFPRK
jgi:hypothetical protein